jgi:hypothetical protein
MVKSVMDLSGSGYGLVTGYSGHSNENLLAR